MSKHYQLTNIKSPNSLKYEEEELISQNTSFEHEGGNNNFALN